ncbi:hypothetical protein Gotur_006739 [Gossypium turneri]
MGRKHIANGHWKWNELLRKAMMKMPTQKSIFMCIYKEYRYPKLAENKDGRIQGFATMLQVKVFADSWAKTAILAPRFVIYN